MVKLKLNPKQAWYLTEILRNIDGDPDGPRGEIDKILEKLENRMDDWEDEAAEGRPFVITDNSGRTEPAFIGRDINYERRKTRI